MPAASEAARHRCQQVISGKASHRTGAKSGERTADLIGGKDPGDDDRRVSAPEQLVRQSKGCWTGCNTVEAVKDREDRQADNVELGKGNDNVRQPRASRNTRIAECAD